MAEDIQDVVHLRITMLICRKKPSECFEKLVVEHLLPFAKQSTTEEFHNLLHRPEVQMIFAEFDHEINLVFKHFAAGDVKTAQVCSPCLHDAFQQRLRAFDRIGTFGTLRNYRTWRPDVYCACFFLVFPKVTCYCLHLTLTSLDSEGH